MLGDAILVGPVLDPDVKQIPVYLPILPGNETWIHVWTLDTLPSGGWTPVDTPLGKPAVFIRQSHWNRTSLKSFKRWVDSLSGRHDDASTTDSFVSR